MSDAFFQSPILNSPYQEPHRHWELERCHINLAAIDSDWEAEFCRVADRPRACWPG